MKHHTAEVPNLEVKVTMTAVVKMSVDEAHVVTKQVAVDAPVREHVAEMIYHAAYEKEDTAVTVAMEIKENCWQEIAVVIADTGSVAVDVVGAAAAAAVGVPVVYRFDYGFDFGVENTGYYALAAVEASEVDVDQKNSDLLKKPSDLSRQRSHHYSG